MVGLLPDNGCRPTLSPSNYWISISSRDKEHASREETLRCDSQMSVLGEMMMQGFLVAAQARTCSQSPSFILRPLDERERVELSGFLSMVLPCPDEEARDHQFPKRAQPFPLVSN